MATAMTVIVTERVLTYTPLTPASTPFTRVRTIPAPGRGADEGGGLAGGASGGIGVLDMCHVYATSYQPSRSRSIAAYGTV